jgi:toxin YoeB
MVKQIVWSEQAHQDRKRILHYWIDKNKSNTYSIKLNRLFKEATQLLSEFPRIGKPTSVDGVRAKIVRDYYIFYQETSTRIFILSIWDTRQHPASADEKLK